MTEKQIKRFAVVSLLFFISVIPAAIFSAFVLSQLWLWFVVPLGVKPIGIAWALGLGSVVGYMTYHKSYQDIKDEQRLRTVGLTAEEKLDRLVGMLACIWCRPMLAYIFGAIYHHFM